MVNWLGRYRSKNMIISVYLANSWENIGLVEVFNMKTTKMFLRNFKIDLFAEICAFENFKSRTYFCRSYSLFSYFLWYFKRTVGIWIVTLFLTICKYFIFFIIFFRGITLSFSAICNILLSFFFLFCFFLALVSEAILFRW